MARQKTIKDFELNFSSFILFILFLSLILNFMKSTKEARTNKTCLKIYI